MDSYYKLQQLFYYKVRHGLIQIATVLQSAMDLLQIATGITKCDDYYNLRQYTWSLNKNRTAGTLFREKVRTHLSWDMCSFMLSLKVPHKRRVA